MYLFQELRDKNNSFIYKSFDFIDDGTNLSLEFEYNLVEDTKTTVFIHKLDIKKSHKISICKNIDNIIFHIGLIEAINYWKIATPKDFFIRCGYINDEQIQWFKKLYYNGLGEFLYINQISISIDDFVDFKIENDFEAFEIISCKTENNNIIPIGGGKDSLVTYELLKDEFPNSYLFSINPIKASQNILDRNPKNSIVLSRKLDMQILKFNKQGYLNGHIPFSSIVGFISIYLGLLYKIKYIVLSNESSANEENVVFNDLKVNHQYSKSLEFENDFRYYISKFITKDVEYFSFLRPLEEIQIASLFSKNKEYFDIFLSCNVGSKEDRWCGKCPKCMFTYMMLCNFIEDDTMIRIFGKNMFEDKDLELIFNKLYKTTEVKPFECVGTYDEVNYALQKKIQSYKKDKLPYLLKKYDAPLIGDYDLSVDYKSQNNLPNIFKDILKKYVI
ncbi:MAG: hypothetical protein U9O56_10175 [Campylobacterota bacterium]|nr:hypothetical protein [Campylobacterota bacterium]